MAVKRLQTMVEKRTTDATRYGTEATTEVRIVSDSENESKRWLQHRVSATHRRVEPSPRSRRWITSKTAHGVVWVVRGKLLIVGLI